MKLLVRERPKARPTRGGSTEWVVRLIEGPRAYERAFGDEPQARHFEAEVQDLGGWPEPMVVTDRAERMKGVGAKAGNMVALTRDPGLPAAGGAALRLRSG